MQHTRYNSLFLSSLRGLIAIAALTATHFCAPATARAEPMQKAATATPTFEGWLARADEIKVQDDASELYGAARFYAQQGEHDKAIALWQRALLIPAASGANPPGMMPGPRDYRGIARWGIAESLRAQEKWSEALTMYRLNREESPLDDGCVQSGAAFQTMAISEGICLENLGRHDEAVQLYWPAAIVLYAGAPPLAMRRLIDLYSASGQLAVLDDAIEREQQQFIEAARQTAGGDDTRPLDEEGQRLFELLVSNSSLPYLAKIRQFRTAARAGNWQPLLAVLQKEPADKGQRETTLLREVFETLTLAPAQAVPVLESALKTAPDNLQLQAALLYCRANEKQRAELFDGGPQSEAENVLRAIGPRKSPSPNFPAIPENLTLPDSLQNLRDNF